MGERRQKRQPAIAIWLILSLILSFLIGALAITPSPAGAAETPAAVVDTDGDGIENNQDSDVDGDGFVNGEDEDIDGDGIANFDDADPIDTTDIDSNAPQKPIRPAGVQEEQAQIWWAILGGTLAGLVGVFSYFRLRKNR
jgi:hypothetical protein